MLREEFNLPWLAVTVEAITPQHAAVAISGAPFTPGCGGGTWAKHLVQECTFTIYTVSNTATPGRQAGVLPRNHAILHGRTHQEQSVRPGYGTTWTCPYGNTCSNNTARVDRLFKHAGSTVPLPPPSHIRVVHPVYVMSGWLKPNTEPRASDWLLCSTRCSV